VTATFACRHSRPIREEYAISDEDARYCADDITILEEMRRHTGYYAEHAWKYAEDSLTECLRRAEQHRAAERAEQAANERRTGEEARAAAAAADKRWATERDEAIAREQGEIERRRRQAMDSPRNRRIAWSAFTCALQRQRAESKAEIAEEQKYANEGGGIVDMRKLYMHQQVIRMADHGLRISAEKLHALRATQMPCDEPRVKNAAECRRTLDVAVCDHTAAETYLEITAATWDELRAELLK